MTKTKVSVIIPLAPNESLSIKFTKQLLALPNNWEVLFGSPKMIDISILKNGNVKFISAQNGRANCLNEGAKHAKGEFLWFLHADSFLASGTISRLNKIVESNIRALYYFDLAYYSKDCRLVKLNEWGAWFRCRCLKTPFGDQGFFMRKDLFNEFGVYSTDAPYGEDHLLIRKFRSNNVPIKPIGIKLYTSARKYELYGWFKTTITNLYYWRKQVYLDERGHGKETRNGNSSRNIWQDSRPFSR